MPAHPAQVPSSSQKMHVSPDACVDFVYDREKVERLRPKVDITEGMAPLFKALADDTRIKIVYALSEAGELCVCDVAMVVGCSLATASHHLRLLRTMRVAKRRREGKMVFYSLHDDHVRDLLRVALEHVLEEREESDGGHEHSIDPA